MDYRSQPAGAGSKPPHAAVFKRRGGERWGKGGRDPSGE